MSNINELVMESMGSYRDSISSGDNGKTFSHIVSKVHPTMSKSGTGAEVMQHAKMSRNMGAISNPTSTFAKYNATSHSGMGSVRGAVGETHSGNIVSGISNLINKFRN